MKSSLVCCWLLLATCSCGSRSKNDADKSLASAAAMAPTLPDTCQAEVGTGEAVKVDDFEDGDLLLDTRASLHGLWYVNNDGTGEQSPPSGEDAPALLESPGSPLSKRAALHTSGSNFTQWGAFVATRLNASKSYACTFDISSYNGVSLSVKGVGALRMNLGTVATTPEDDGGECQTDICSDYGQVVKLSSDWQSVSISFSELSQPAWASTSAWDPTRALRISFWAEAGDFDFWVDDLKLFR